MVVERHDLEPELAGELAHVQRLDAVLVGIGEGGAQHAFFAQGNAGLVLGPVSATRPAKRLTLALRPELIADQAEVLAAIDDGAVCLIDALSEAHYRGDYAMWDRPGHIPGAENAPSDALLHETGRYDVIFDNVGNYPPSAIKRVLVPKGIYVLVGGPKTGRVLGPMESLLRSVLGFMFSGRKAVRLNTHQTRDDLLVLQELLESGKVTSVIDRCYELSEVPDAFRYLEEGHARGKIIITP